MDCNEYCYDDLNNWHSIHHDCQGNHVCPRFTRVCRISKGNGNIRMENSKHMTPLFLKHCGKRYYKQTNKHKLLPDLKPLHNVPKHTLFKLFRWKQMVDLCFIMLSITVRALSIIPISIDLHVK